MIWNCRERLGVSSCGWLFQLEAADIEADDSLGRGSKVGNDSVFGGTDELASVVAAMGDPGSIGGGGSETDPAGSAMPATAGAGARNCSCHSSRPLSNVRRTA